MYFKTIKSVLNVYHLYLKLYEKKSNTLCDILKEKMSKKYSSNDRFNWILTNVKKYR